MAGVVRDHVGLHSTDYWTPYLSLWARLGQLDAAAFYAELQTGGAYVRVNAWRQTVHVIHASDVPLVLRACGSRLGAVGRRGLNAVSSADFEAVLGTIGAAVADGPLDVNALKEAVPAIRAQSRNWILAAMGAGILVRGRAAHARSNRCEYDSLVGLVPDPRSIDEARRALLQRYVAAFGPVCDDDMAWWLPATRREVHAALSTLGPTFFSIEEDGRRWYAPCTLLEGAEPAPPGVWLLPYEDALPKGYVERSWYLSDRSRAVVYPHNVEDLHPADFLAASKPQGANRTGEIRPSIWHEGRVVGRWEFAKADSVVGRIHEDVGAQATAQVDDALHRLEGFVRAQLVPIS